MTVIVHRIDRCHSVVANDGVLALGVRIPLKLSAVRADYNLVDTVNTSSLGITENVSCRGRNVAVPGPHLTKVSVGIDVKYRKATTVVLRILVDIFFRGHKSLGTIRAVVVGCLLGSICELIIGQILTCGKLVIGSDYNVKHILTVVKQVVFDFIPDAEASDCVVIGIDLDSLEEELSAARAAYVIRLGYDQLAIYDLTAALVRNGIIGSAGMIHAFVSHDLKNNVLVDLVDLMPDLMAFLVCGIAIHAVGAMTFVTGPDLDVVPDPTDHLALSAQDLFFIILVFVRVIAGVIQKLQRLSLSANTFEYHHLTAMRTAVFGKIDRAALVIIDMIIMSAASRLSARQAGFALNDTVVTKLCTFC